VDEHLSFEPAQLVVEWDDGRRDALPALWLRDNCPCPACRHESGQRLLDTRWLPDDLAILSAEANGSIAVSFSDGHESRFDAAWLRANSGEPTARTRRLWGAEIQHALPVHRYEEVVEDGEALRAWLADLDELGFALLLGGPTEPGTVTRVAELFGFVRETNYGRLFDVKTVVNPNNLAYTGLGLGAHTDNPYRDPTPTLQLLHCLASSAEGGANTAVDGFRVAADLPREQLELLAGNPIRFRFADADTELEAETPVISLDPHGEPQAVHYNTRSAAPFRLPADVLIPYYEAYQQFGRRLEAPEYRVQFKLDAGDLFVVDNLRVLHGRTAYSAVHGERHLQGCYADRDALRSRLAVLSR
jgi:gamma-butyrobetaine hydroxylase